ncbi:MAG: hypothetical protein AAGK21_03815 [Bacteroidota bacterium]
MARFLVLLCLAGLSASTVDAQRGRISDIQRERALPEVQYRLTGGVSFTNISGHPGDSIAFMDSPGPHYVLYGLSFQENSDDPCTISGDFWSRPDGGADAVQATRGAGSGADGSGAPFNCRGRGSSDRAVEASYPDPNVRAAIHGIQVCTNNRNDNNIKLKGVRIFTSALNRDGDLDIARDPAHADEFERPNCREPWGRVQRCPVGQVATGVRVYYRADQDRRDQSITGLALRCQALEMTRPLPGVPGRN